MYETLKSWYYQLFGNAEPVARKKPRKILTREEVHSIEFDMFIDNKDYSQVELAIKYGVSTSVISKIYIGTHRYSNKRLGDDLEEHCGA